MLPKFPSDIKRWKYIIERKARYLGLSFFQIIYEMVDMQSIAALAAYSGMPGRDHNYLHGQSYMDMETRHLFGLARIYEMVINNDPVYGYLLDSNSLTDHKAVMAHVCGHADFFMNNQYFAGTYRGMVDRLSVLSGRIEEFKRRHGEETVENFRILALSLQELTDPFGAPYMRPVTDGAPVRERDVPRVEVSRNYLDEYVNPEFAVRRIRKQLRAHELHEEAVRRGLRYPGRPTRDVVGFLLAHAPLKAWQREVLAITRLEYNYFYPQRLTKIMNEGWAEYWQAELCLTHGVIKRNEAADYADHTAGVIAPGRGSLNPYWLGLNIWKDIKYRWDTNRHGDIYERCSRSEVLAQWDDFVVFKALYEKHGGDAGAITHAWNEFHALLRCMREGKQNFPRRAFDSALQVQYFLMWNDPENYISPAHKELRGLKAEYEDLLARRDAEDEDSEHIQYELEALQEHKDMLRAQLRVPTIIKALGKRIAAGKYPLENLVIPLEFWEYAAEHVDTLIELGRGVEKLFEVRAGYNDYAFIDDFLTHDLARRLRLFSFQPGGGGRPSDHWGVDMTADIGAEMVRNKLLKQMSNGGTPVAEVVDGNYRKKGWLLIRHVWDHLDLHIDDAKEIIKLLYKIWNKPVVLETHVTVDDEDALYLIIDQLMRGEKPESLNYEVVAAKATLTCKNGTKVDVEINEDDVIRTKKLF